jgi:protein gp37
LDSSEQEQPTAIAWVVVGGGPFPVHPDWVRSIRDQCQAAGVPFFFKGWGDWLHESQGQWCGREADTKHYNLLQLPEKQWAKHIHVWPDHTRSFCLGKKATGRLLDGREWNEIPIRNAP